MIYGCVVEYYNPSTHKHPAVVFPLLFVSQVIDRMKEKHPSMSWEVGDMTQLKSVFKGREGTLSAIVDKVGTNSCYSVSNALNVVFFRELVHIYMARCILGDHS